MILTNFTLGSLPQTIEIEGLGNYWDLHNFADFVGYKMALKSNLFTMTWQATKNENPWGDPNNRAPSCKLIFIKPDFIRITPRDPEYPLSEDLALSGISKIVPGESKEIGYRTEWRPNEDCNLLFEFNGGVDIELHSESVELAAIFE